MPIVMAREGQSCLPRWADEQACWSVPAIVRSTDYAFQRASLLLPSSGHGTHRLLGWTDAGPWRSTANLVTKSVPCEVRFTLRQACLPPAQCTNRWVVPQLAVYVRLPGSKIALATQNGQACLVYSIQNIIFRAHASVSRTCRFCTARSPSAFERTIFKSAQGLFFLIYTVEKTL